MDKEKEIQAKEMAKVMCLGCTQINCEPDFGCVVYNLARRAVEAGYGNIKRATKEVLESLKRSFGRRKFKRRVRLIIEETIDEHIKLYGADVKE